ncbi:hypothetical protein BKA58DRAFT_168519 [Alternaria rosae]|uniref:uncharacterized protein n=1 Tax=Alternaria rosae TaxID=1187941 RepID=UPI001E8E1DC8|nr:uncharacterized protein BKA58DRAFT_168519 [Alternaria rosae]KAH6869967.1 hypothetical protein BKA58DRAFT_168519 [Alternaria rosae]
MREGVALLAGWVGEAEGRRRGGGGCLLFQVFCLSVLRASLHALTPSQEEKMLHCWHPLHIPHPKVQYQRETRPGPGVVVQAFELSCRLRVDFGQPQLVLYLPSRSSGGVADPQSEAAGCVLFDLEIIVSTPGLRQSPGSCLHRSHRNVHVSRLVEARLGTLPK